MYALGVLSQWCKHFTQSVPVELVEVFKVCIKSVVELEVLPFSPFKCHVRDFGGHPILFLSQANNPNQFLSRNTDSLNRPLQDLIHCSSYAHFPSIFPTKYSLYLV